MRTIKGIDLISTDHYATFHPYGLLGGSCCNVLTVSPNGVSGTARATPVPSHRSC